MRTLALTVPMIVAAALAAVAASSPAKATASCTVTVFYTDEKGNVDPGSKGVDRACKPGERNGSVELYNPYTNTSVIHTDVPLEPLDPSGGGGGGGGSSSTHGGSSSSGSSASSGPPLNRGCRPPPPNGSKTHRQTAQSPHSGTSYCPPESSTPVLN